MLDVTEDIKNEVRRYCAGVPDYVLDNAIHKGARRFLLESEIWTEEQKLSAWNDSVLVDTNEANTFVCGVKKVLTETGRELPARYYAGKLHFQTAPNCDVIAHLVVTTDGSITVIPNWVVNQYREGFIHAALQKLTSQANQPWFDPEAAIYHEKEYRFAMGQARISCTDCKVSLAPFA